MNVERSSPNQRGPVLVEADKMAETTRLEPDPDFCDEPQDDGPQP